MRRKFLVLDQQGQDLNNSNVGNLSQISSAYEVTTAKVLKGSLLLLSHQYVTHFSDESPKEYEVGEKALSPEIFCASRSNWYLLRFLSYQKNGVLFVKAAPMHRFGSIYIRPINGMCRYKCK
jgi:hypothetical protein